MIILIIYDDRRVIVIVVVETKSFKRVLPHCILLSPIAIGHELLLFMRSSGGAEGGAPNYKVPP